VFHTGSLTDGGGQIYHTDSLGPNIWDKQGGMGSGWSSTQHPLYFLRTHSRASPMQNLNDLYRVIYWY